MVWYFIKSQTTVNNNTDKLTVSFDQAGFEKERDTPGYAPRICLSIPIYPFQYPREIQAEHRTQPCTTTRLFALRSKLRIFLHRRDIDPPSYKWKKPPVPSPPLHGDVERYFWFNLPSRLGGAYFKHPYVFAFPRV